MKINAKTKANNLLCKSKEKALIDLTNIFQRYREISSRHRLCKIQKKRDHNLIEIFKHKYPNEFIDSLNQYEKLFGKDYKLK